jgi:hypothetical protein
MIDSVIGSAKVAAGNAAAAPATRTAAARSRVGFAKIPIHTSLALTLPNAGCHLFVN